MSDLLSTLEAHERLMQWWAGFLDSCAQRQSRRINIYSARSHKSARTRRLNERNNRGLAPAFGTALSPSVEPVPVSPLRASIAGAAHNHQGEQA